MGSTSRGLSFCVGFFPGLLVGSSSVLLLITIWKLPVSVYYTKEREFIVDRDIGQNDDSFPYDQNSKFERRHALQTQNGNNECDKNYLDSSASEEGVPYFLLVLVHSSPSSFGLRNGIRDTWLGENHHQRKYMARFVVGLAGLSPHELNLLACENKDYRDMVFLPEFNESLNHSKSEKLLHSFSWAEENVDYEYLFKCTDSTFAILEVIFNELTQRSSDLDLLWGFFAGGVQATREGHLKEPNWFLCTHYLPYPQGGGYVISKGLVSVIDALGPDLSHYVHDDIALGVWLSPFKWIKFIHDVRFNTGYSSRGCNNLYIVTHGETVQSTNKKYAAVKKKAPLCETEHIFRPSYEYNWSVPADR